MEIEKENLSKRIPTRDYSSLTWYLGSRPANQLYQIGMIPASRVRPRRPEASPLPSSRQVTSLRRAPIWPALTACVRVIAFYGKSMSVDSVVLSRLPQSALNLWGWTDHVTRKHLQADNRDPIQNQFLVLSPPDSIPFNRAPAFSINQSKKNVWAIQT